MKYTINQGIGIFENAIPEEWCDYLIDLYKDNKIHHKTRRELDKVSSDQKEDTSLSINYVNKDFCDKFIKHFYKTIYPPYSKVFFDLDNSSFHTIYHVKMQKTLPSQGYHVWHSENNNVNYARRVAVWTVYLNDVEEGGETEFLYQSLRVKPKKGTAMIFPSGYYHTHRGNPPLSGEKYIITGWIELIEEPKNE